MTLKEKFTQVINYFLKTNPDPVPELKFGSPYELVVAVILSAQCTDKRVNMITPVFFKSFPTPAKLAAANVPEIYQVIKSCSYPNNKSKNLLGMAQMLINDYHGVLPRDTQELQKLPGVGRKTAHVLTSVLFNQPTLAVDTHVFRVSARLGLTKNATNPLQCEQQLMKHVPEEYIFKFHHWLILHGRYVCMARKPKCQECGLASICSYYQQVVENPK